jgi:surface protein
MSFRNVQGNNVTSRALQTFAIRQAAAWVRNPAWPALTAPTIGEQKLVGLYAVWPGDGVGNGGNFFAVNCASAYTVAFGDGTSVNTATGVQTNYEYNFADVDLYDATVTLTDAGDLVERTAHGYTNGMRVQFYRIVTTTGLVEAQSYFVVNATANNFQVAATQGGAALGLTTNGSASLLPYKIATVTITPQAGQNLTAVDLFVKDPTTGLQAYSTGWLDLAVAGANITSLTLGSNAITIRHEYVERVNIVELGAVTTFASLFQNFRRLQNVSLNAPATVTNMSSMFNSCYSLVSIPLFNTAAVTDTNSMFASCYSLAIVPLLNTAAVTNMATMFSTCHSLPFVPLFNTAAVTNMASMFLGCGSLPFVPLFNTAAVTDMSNMFNSCNSLLKVPFFNTAAVTNMTGMFSSCRNLTTVPLFNTAAVTNMINMFSTCVKLATVPLFNTAAVTSMTNMFSTCSSLVTVPLFNTAAVTNMSLMLANCRNLTTVPLFNTAAVTNMSSMLNGCSTLTTVPLFNTAAVTDMSNMFNSCNSLAAIPLFNTAAVTVIFSMFGSCISLSSVPALVVTAVTTGNFVAMFINCNSLARIEAKNFRFSFSVANCKLSATALNEIYTNLPVAVGQTITVTNNYGTTGDDPTIATAKEWTVTG